MSEMKLKVAMIGCGQIAKMHIPAVLAKKECELYAACRATVESAKIGAPVKNQYPEV